MKLKLILFLVIIASQDKIHAFSKCNHYMLSIEAVERYIYISGKTISQDEKKAFAEGSVYEDKVIRLFHKNFNQHFYAKGVDLKKNNTFLRNFKNLYCKLYQLKDEDNKLKYWKTLGRISHYLQDMACPPHVMPIYHLGNDKFDDIFFQPKGIPWENLTMANLTGCQKYDPIELLDIYSDRTVKSVKSPLPLYINNIHVEKTWELFWSRDTRTTCRRNFRRYGVAGNKYGNTNFKSKDKTEFNIEKGSYEKFNANRLNQAIEATMVLIHYGINLKS